MGFWDWNGLGLLIRNPQNPRMLMNGRTVGSRAYIQLNRDTDHGAMIYIRAGCLKCPENCCWSAGRWKGVTMEIGHQVNPPKLFTRISSVTNLITSHTPLHLWSMISSIDQLGTRGGGEGRLVWIYLNIVLLRRKSIPAFQTELSLLWLPSSVLAIGHLKWDVVTELTPREPQPDERNALEMEKVLPTQETTTTCLCFCVIHVDDEVAVIKVCRSPPHHQLQIPPQRICLWHWRRRTVLGGDQLMRSSNTFINWPGKRFFGCTASEENNGTRE